ncbi:MAG: LytTR family DNA-binding domain-containing protein [Oscillospiraceae bacterium]|nr:LytTR family DNA-binding domain-containing protein [Oscillospiraceae bacterium]
MLNIAVCDSDGRDIDLLIHHLNIWAEQSGVIIKTDSFLRSFDLLDRFEMGQAFDLFIINTVMPGMSGLELVHYLRKRGISAPVIFVTEDSSHALEAFSVGAVQYLLKPLNADAFYDAMHAAYTAVGSDRRRQIAFKTVEGFRHVYLRNIIYTETDGKYQLVHLEGDEVLIVRMTAKVMGDILCEYNNFTRCGSSYVLNLAHISVLEAKSVSLTGNFTVPVPRGAYEKVVSAYIAFFNRKRV